MPQRHTGKDNRPLEDSGATVFSEHWIEELKTLRKPDERTEPRRWAAQVLHEAGIVSPHLEWDDFDDFTMIEDNVNTRKIDAEDRKWTEENRLAFLAGWFTDDSEEDLEPRP